MGAPSAAPTETPTVAPTPAPTPSPITTSTTTTTTTTSTTTTTKAPTSGYSVHPNKYCHTGHGAHRIGITYPFQEGSPWKSGNKWSNASVHVKKNEANAEGCRADCDAN